MKEFEKLILGNLQETVIAPALMRVASVSVAHPNAVRAAVPEGELRAQMTLCMIEQKYGTPIS